VVPLALHFLGPVPERTRAGLSIDPKKQHGWVVRKGVNKMSKFIRGVAEVLEKGHLVTYFVQHTGIYMLPTTMSYWISELVIIPLATLVLRHGEQTCLYIARGFSFINRTIGIGWAKFCDGLIRGIGWMKG
jgi:hypothetical protein